LRPNCRRWRHGYYWQPIKNRQRPIQWYHRRSPTTYRLATIPHDWHTIERYAFSRPSKVNDFHVISKPICDFLLVINSNLGPISHRLATTHSWRTTDRQTTTHTISSTVTYRRSAKTISLRCPIIFQRRSFSRTYGIWKQIFYAFTCTCCSHIFMSTVIHKERIEALCQTSMKAKRLIVNQLIKRSIAFSANPPRATARMCDKK